jgi:NAD(P)-dependent dehydrogenase (short-subunit alcohol dehydrogenase family)
MTSSVVVTGGHTGIGGACTRHLIAAGRHVVVASRDLGRARSELGDLAGRVELRPLDLDSLAAVRDFTDLLVASSADRPPLTAVVCNAGVQIVGAPERSADGFERTYAVNHLAHFLLVRRLLPQLATPGRIVMLGSGTHDPAQKTGIAPPRYRGGRGLAEPDADTLAAEGPLRTGHRAYSTSKLCNIMFAYALAERLRSEGSTTTANAYDPGLVPGTGLARQYGAAARFLFTRVAPALVPVMKPFFHAQSLDEAGRNLARMVTEPSLATVSGSYVAGTKPIRSSEESYDAAKQRDLWDESEKLVQ